MTPVNQNIDEHFIFGYFIVAKAMICTQIIRCGKWLATEFKWTDTSYADTDERRCLCLRSFSVSDVQPHVQAVAYNKLTIGNLQFKISSNVCWFIHCVSHPQTVRRGKRMAWMPKFALDNQDELENSFHPQT